MKLVFVFVPGITDRFIPHPPVKVISMFYYRNGSLQLTWHSAHRKTIEISLRTVLYFDRQFSGVSSSLPGRWWWWAVSCWASWAANMLPPSGQFQLALLDDRQHADEECFSLLLYWLCSVKMFFFFFLQKLWNPKTTL